MQSEVRNGKVVIKHNGQEIVLDIWDAHQAAMQMLKAINDADNARTESGEAKR
jgi:hypothetical protein